MKKIIYKINHFKKNSAAYILVLRWIIYGKSTALDVPKDSKQSKEDKYNIEE